MNNINNNRIKQISKCILLLSAHFFRSIQFNNTIFFYPPFIRFLPFECKIKIQSFFSKWNYLHLLLFRINIQLLRINDYLKTKYVSKDIYFIKLILSFLKHFVEHEDLILNIVLTLVLMIFYRGVNVITEMFDLFR